MELPTRPSVRAAWATLGVRDKVKGARRSRAAIHRVIDFLFERSIMKLHSGFSRGPARDGGELFYIQSTKSLDDTQKIFIVKSTEF